MKREDTIRKILKEAGIYDAKLEPQISLVARLERRIRVLEQELSKSDVIETEITASGTEHKVLNPLVSALSNMDSQLMKAYTALGLTYDIAPQRIHDAKPVKQELTAFDKLMSGEE